VTDKPAHILEIPDSLGRDVDKAREGKLKNPLPVEAFMSEGALQEVQDRSSAPVHAEDLVPITKAEAARRTTFDGEHLPRVPANRRVLPAPFRRERVSLDRHGRAWQSCRADAVQAGDVVPEVGRVAGIDTDIRYETVAGIPDVATGMKVILVGIDGSRTALDPAQQVRAFRLAELWRPGRPGVSPTSGAERGSARTGTRRRGSGLPGSTTTRRWRSTTRTSSCWRTCGS
jgi:hypothetical protein